MRRQLAWGLLAATVALSLLSIALLAMSAATPAPSRFGFRGSALLLALPLAAVGAVVASRRPGNPVGWLFCAAGLLYGLDACAQEYRVVAVLAQPGGLPLAAQVAWIPSWIWPLSQGCLVLALLLFPDGRPLSPRWWPVVWLAGAAPAASALGFALLPGPLEEFAALDNPFGRPRLAYLAELCALLGFAGTVVALAAAGASLALRFRNARGRQRHQLKWVAYAASLAAAALLASLAAVLAVGPERVPGAIEALVVLGIAGVPVAAGVAILHDRLYEIDRIINRTVVYGLVTALLSVLYGGAVFVLGPLVSALGAGSDLAVAASTLTVAAAFRPARHRVQRAVDRRFNRRRADAADLIAAFAARLRDEIDLDALVAELPAVVGATLQPERISLWLRPGRAP